MKFITNTDRETAHQIIRESGRDAYFIASPKATELYSVEDLERMGLVGVWETGLPFKIKVLALTEKEPTFRFTPLLLEE